MAGGRPAGAIIRAPGGANDRAPPGVAVDRRGRRSYLSC